MQIHIIPKNDERPHTACCACWCEPRLDIIDPETGSPYHDGHSMVVHHAADGREASEHITGEIVAPGLGWETLCLD